MPQQNCSYSNEGFNYCKVAKRLIAIPAYPLIAFIAASFFTQVLYQVVAAIGAVILTYRIAIWLDSIPLFMKKFRNI